MIVAVLHFINNQATVNLFSNGPAHCCYCVSGLAVLEFVCIALK